MIQLFNISTLGLTSSQFSYRVKLARGIDYGQKPKTEGNFFWNVVIKSKIISRNIIMTEIRKGKKKTIELTAYTQEGI